MSRPGSAGRFAGVAVLGAISAFGHLLYPAWLALTTRTRTAPEPPVATEWPNVTVVIAAYREKAVIADKVEDVLANDYPGALEVIVVADDPDTASAARTTSAKVIESSERLGKAGAVDRGVQEATGSVIVITDANARLAPGALEALVRWFADPTVGAVAGEKRVLGGGDRLYWQFESWLKQRESRTGTTIGLVGEIAAFDPDVYRPLPRDVLDDLWLVLDIVTAGKRIVYEPKAVAIEVGSSTLSEEWERRTRNVAGALDIFWRRRELLACSGTPVTGQLWGHRVVRLSFGPLAHAALLLLALRSLGTSRLAGGFCLVHLVGIEALVRRARGRGLTSAERLLSQMLFLQAVGLGGTIRWLRHGPAGIWPKDERVTSLPPPE
jgi:poly-beta-1,6-N-acetyl-D-glucosamine synthase